MEKMELKAKTSKKGKPTNCMNFKHYMIKTDVSDRFHGDIFS